MTGLYRLGPLSGIGAMILFFTGFLVPGQPPAANASLTIIATGFHDHRQGILAGCLLLTLGAALYLWFVCVLHSALAHAEGGRHTLSNLWFAGGVASALFVVIGFAPAAAAAFTLADVPGTESALIIRGLFDLANILSLLGNVLFAAGALAAAAVIAQTTVLPRWLAGVIAAAGVLGVLTGLGVLSATGPFAPGGPFFVGSFAVFAIATIATSVILFRHPVGVIDGVTSASPDSVSA